MTKPNRLRVCPQVVRKSDSRDCGSICKRHTGEQTSASTTTERREVALRPRFTGTVERSTGTCQTWLRECSLSSFLLPTQRLSRFKQSISTKRIRYGGPTEVGTHNQVHAIPHGEQVGLIGFTSNAIGKAHSTNAPYRQSSAMRTSNLNPYQPSSQYD